jgi:hypothetical protein
MNLTQKISQMTPKGADLDATDLIEVSTIVGGSYVTKSITGQELIDAIPLPPTGLTVGTTPIASGTIGRVLFQGTGNVLQQSSSLFWDSTNNRLGIGTSTPAYQFNIENANQSLYSTNIGPYVDLVNQTKGAGGVSSLSVLNDTNINLVSAIYSSAETGTFMGQNRANRAYVYTSNASSLGILTVNNVPLQFGTNNVERMRVAATTGNVLINTTTDAGFRLDVNGTARVQSKLTIGNSTASPYQLNVWGGAIESYISLNNTNSGALNTDGFQIGLEANGTDVYFINRENGFIQFRTNGLDRFRVANTGNVLINTTTDAGFRLDVNGTARFQNEFIINRSDGVQMLGMYNSPAVVAFNGNNSSAPTLRLHSQSGILFYLKASENRIGINTISPNASAILDVASTTQGFLPPRMTTTQKNAIASPATGLQVFDTTLNQMSYYNGTTWTNI